jgi:hypothetical protein
MILLISVILGLFATILRSILRKRQLQPVKLRSEWVVILAFILQLTAFNIPTLSQSLSDRWVSTLLILSLILLVLFALINWETTGMLFLGSGAFANFLVIVINGGFMPIRPELLAHYQPYGNWEIGQRLINSKDMILPVAETKLWWLSDWFTFPDWIPVKVAFSAGDIVMALGAFLLLWSLSRPDNYSLEKNHDTNSSSSEKKLFDTF